MWSPVGTGTSTYPSGPEGGDEPVEPVSLGVRHPDASAETGDVAALADALRRQGGGEVRFDAGPRAASSTDSSNCRQVPIGVVVPRTVDAAAAAIRVCRDHDVPIVN